MTENATPCVIYAAKSTKDVRGSIPDQFEDGRKLAGRKHLPVAAEYHDEDESAYHGDRGNSCQSAALSDPSV
jgi:hypothetical protein